MKREKLKLFGKNKTYGRASVFVRLKVLLINVIAENYLVDEIINAHLADQQATAVDLTT